MSGFMELLVLSGGTPGTLFVTLLSYYDIVMLHSVGSSLCTCTCACVCESMNLKHSVHVL